MRVCQGWSCVHGGACSRLAGAPPTPPFVLLCWSLSNAQVFPSAARELRPCMGAPPRALTPALTTCLPACLLGCPFWPS